MTCFFHFISFHFQFTSSFIVSIVHHSFFFLINSVEQAFLEFQRQLEQRKQELILQIQHHIHGDDSNDTSNNSNNSNIHHPTTWQRVSTLSTQASDLASDVKQFIEETKCAASDFLSQYSAKANHLTNLMNSAQTLIEQDQKRKEMAESGQPITIKARISMEEMNTLIPTVGLIIRPPLVPCFDEKSTKPDFKHSRLILDWSSSIPANEHSSVDRYEVLHSIMQDDKTADEGVNVVHRGKATRYVHDMENLSTGKHLFQVRSINELGESALSPAFRFAVESGEID